MSRMSSSIHSGSSGKKRRESWTAGGFDWAPSVVALSAVIAITTRTNFLEAIFEPQVRHEALAAVGQIEPCQKRVVAVKTEADAVGGLEGSDLEIAEPVHDLARVHEHGGVERPPRFPLIFGRHRHGLAIAEAPIAETAQRRQAAKRGQIDDRHA